MSILNYFAKSLRKHSTDAELKLWHHLRGKRMLSLKFRRQQPIGPYIVDFVCCDRKIVIECDGGQHLESEKDLSRDAWLTRQGYRVLRFWDNEILLNLDDVLETIYRMCTDHPPSDSLPSREGEN